MDKTIKLAIASAVALITGVFVFLQPQSLLRSISLIILPIFAFIFIYKGSEILDLLLGREKIKLEEPRKIWEDLRQVIDYRLAWRLPDFRAVREVYLKAKHYYFFVYSPFLSEGKYMPFSSIVITDARAGLSLAERGIQHIQDVSVGEPTAKLKDAYTLVKETIDETPIPRYPLPYTNKKRGAKNYYFAPPLPNEEGEKNEE